MLLVDVNVLVHAFREDAEDHDRYAAWLDGLLNGDQAFGIADWVLSGFLRVVTHPKIFDPPSDISVALEFAEDVRACPRSVRVAPGPRHWELFSQLCQLPGIRGNLVPDAYLAALAIESGHEWATTDRDFSRFPGLKCRHPLRP